MPTFHVQIYQLWSFEYHKCIVQHYTGLKSHRQAAAAGSAARPPFSISVGGHRAKQGRLDLVWSSPCGEEDVDATYKHMMSYYPIDADADVMKIATIKTIISTQRKNTKKVAT